MTSGYLQKGRITHVIFNSLRQKTSSTKQIKDYETVLSGNLVILRTIQYKKATTKETAYD